MARQDSNRRTAYTFTDFLAWTLLALVPVLTAIYCISRESAFWTAAYIVILAGCFLVVHRLFCTRCPHYKNAGRATKCIFLWNLPAFFEPRPGPLRLSEKAGVSLAMIIAVAFPVYWILAHPVLLVVYAVSWIVLVAFLNKYECPRCIFEECPMNRAQ